LGKCCLFNIPSQLLYIFAAEVAQKIEFTKNPTGGNFCHLNRFQLHLSRIFGFFASVQNANALIVISGWDAGATTLRIATFPWSIQQKSTALLAGVTIVTPASLTSPSMMPCKC